MHGLSSSNLTLPIVFLSEKKQSTYQNTFLPLMMEPAPKATEPPLVPPKFSSNFWIGLGLKTLENIMKKGIKKKKKGANLQQWFKNLHL